MKRRICWRDVHDSWQRNGAWSQGSQQKSMGCLSIGVWQAFRVSSGQCSGIARRARSQNGWANADWVAQQYAAWPASRQLCSQSQATRSARLDPDARLVGAGIGSTGQSSAESARSCGLEVVSGDSAMVREHRADAFCRPYAQEKVFRRAWLA